MGDYCTKYIMGPEIRLERTLFNSNVKELYSSLKNKSDYHDVTLVCDDNYSVSANKVVLSLASKFFDNIFQLNKHPHPLICLEGITSRNLGLILDYIYFGEVQVHENDISQFLKICTRLQLEGINYQVNDGNESCNTSTQSKEGDNLLTEYLDQVKQKSDEIAKPNEEETLNSLYNSLKVFLKEDSHPNKTIEIENAVDQRDSHPNKTIEIENSEDQRENSNNDEIAENQASLNKNKKSDNMNKSVIINSDEFDSIEQFDQELYAHIGKGNQGGWSCKMCEFRSAHRHHVKEHIESHYKVSFTCPQCSHKYKSRSSLRSHKIKAHGYKKI